MFLVSHQAATITRARVPVLLSWLVILFSLPGVALAHGPTRQKVTEKVEINASAETVWNVIMNFSDASWLPMVESSSADNGNEPGSVRTLVLVDGSKVVERLKAYKGEKMTYKYRIPDATHDVAVLPVNNYSSNITVKADGDKSVVIWKGAFYRGYPNNDPPAELNDEAALKAVTELYQAGLKGLKELIESSS